ncbi:MAG: hypothetical protein IKW99_06715, partial [Bacteroidales bacterium]|nr:hypothetical protein [Bacteroidales bacterium]
PESTHCSGPVLVLFILFPAGSENTGSANLGTSGPFPGRQIRKGKKEEELTRGREKGIGQKMARKCRYGTLTWYSRFRKAQKIPVPEWDEDLGKCQDHPVIHDISDKRNRLFG